MFFDRKKPFARKPADASGFSASGNWAVRQAAGPDKMPQAQYLNCVP